MEQLFLKFVEQLPSTAAVIFVVVVFVNYLSKRDVQRVAENLKRDNLWLDLHREHLEARRADNKAILQNTDALAKNTSAFEAMTARLEGIDYFCPVAHEQGGVHIPKRKPDHESS